MFGLEKEVCRFPFLPYPLDPCFRRLRPRPLLFVSRFELEFQWRSRVIQQVEKGQEVQNRRNIDDAWAKQLIMLGDGNVRYVEAWQLVYPLYLHLPSGERAHRRIPMRATRHLYPFRRYHCHCHCRNLPRHPRTVRARGSRKDEGGK